MTGILSKDEDAWAAPDRVRIVDVLRRLVQGLRVVQESFLVLKKLADCISSDLSTAEE